MVGRTGRVPRQKMGFWRHCAFGLYACWAPSFGAGQAAWRLRKWTPPIIQAACDKTPLSIAQLQWPSASILAHVHAQILRENFGCQVEIVPGDLGATSSSMANTGYPHIAPEMWVGRVANAWNAGIAAQRTRAAAASFSGGGLEGWFVPEYVHAAYPDIRSVQDLAKGLSDLLPKGKQRLQFITCPADWACALINNNLIRAYALEQGFEVIEPANRFELDQLIGSAVSRQEPVVFYYWQPNGILSQFDFYALDMGKYDFEAMQCLAQRECAAAQPSAFAPELVVIALSQIVFEDFPKIAAYFQRASMPLVEMNALLAWQNGGEHSAQAVAAHFVETRPEIWQAWLKN